MSNNGNESIADRIRTKSRTTKKPVIYCSEIEHRNNFWRAWGRSEYLEADFVQVAAGYPDNQAVQELYRKFEDDDDYAETADFIRERDSIISSLLPALKEQGRVPNYDSKYLQDLVIHFNRDQVVTSWWLDYCETKAISWQRTQFQTEFIKKLERNYARSIQRRQQQARREADRSDDVQHLKQCSNGGGNDGKQSK